MKFIILFFDKLEDKVRAFFSRRPIVYAFLTGIGIVMFWRGVWHTNDFLAHIYTSWVPGVGIDLQGALWWDGPLSFVIGSFILLISGTFVYEFIGSEFIISGLKKEKKVAKQTESEVKVEAAEIAELIKDVKEIKKAIIKKK